MTVYYESKVPGVTTKGNIIPKVGSTAGRGTAGQAAAFMPGFGSETGFGFTRTGLSTAISELKDRYADSLRQSYDISAERLKNERDEALREQYIKEQMAQAALPEQLAKFGINGGAAETTLADLMARYQNERRAARKEYRDGLFDLERSLSEKAADASHKYDEKWLDYFIKQLIENGGESYAGLFKL